MVVSTLLRGRVIERSYALHDPLPEHGLAVSKAEDYASQRLCRDNGHPQQGLVVRLIKGSPADHTGQVGRSVVAPVTWFASTKNYSHEVQPQYHFCHFSASQNGQKQTCSCVESQSDRSGNASPLQSAPRLNNGDWLAFDRFMVVAGLQWFR